MAKSIYTYYKERLIEIGGNNRCLYLKNIVRKSAYDLGRIFDMREGKVKELTDFLTTGRRFPLSIISDSERGELISALGIKAKELPDRATEA